MSTPSPSGAPKPPSPAIIPVTPLPGILCVPLPPSTTAQSAKRARTADEEARPAHATTATPNASGSITTFAETLVSEALAKAEVYRSIASALDSDRQGVNSASASPLHSPAPSPIRKAAPPPTPQSDGRIFLRLDRDSPFANNDTFAIRKEVQTFLRLAPPTSLVAIRSLQVFALVPKNDAVRQTLLAHKDEISARFGCVQVEVPKKWVTYAVQNVPMTMRLGMVPVDTTTAIKDEMLVQTSQEPIALRPSQYYHPGEAYAT
ncbi:unnamed protein product [Sordaria macrospora k-hell]|uniref:WGS project CABT00000000 data, contig 2.124 n=1 Tax=Sordaria macrospora (strain ATCC MYA-333 / DSM 997 / K(L3346) / K-hell) TaxID=771870 RepID=F7WCD9_SORMK|nr:uncharacterized protein SMAC_09561 [Sordaria macrospora k-hell]CCC05600.1 unnamed protein product [Sordaria macrospora k-hell]